MFPVRRIALSLRLSFRKFHSLWFGGLPAEATLLFVNGITGVPTDEKDVPATQHKAEKHARIPRAHVNKNRTRSPRPASCKGSQKAYRQRRTIGCATSPFAALANSAESCKAAAGGMKGSSEVMFVSVPPVHRSFVWGLSYRRASMEPLLATGCGDWCGKP